MGPIKEIQAEGADLRARVDGVDPRKPIVEGSSSKGPKAICQAEMPFRGGRADGSPSEEAELKRLIRRGRADEVDPRRLSREAWGKGPSEGADQREPSGKG